MDTVIQYKLHTKSVCIVYFFKDDECEDYKNKQPWETEAMSPLHRDILVKLRVYLVQNLDMSEAALGHFLKERHLTKEHCGLIRWERTKQAKCRKFLDIVTCRGEGAFYALHAAVKYTTNQSFISVALEETEVSSFYLLLFQ